MVDIGLYITMVDTSGEVAVMEKSGTRSAVRRPLPGCDSTVPGAVTDGLFCTNHFLGIEIQGILPCELPSCLAGSRNRNAAYQSPPVSSPIPLIQPWSSSSQYCIKVLSRVDFYWMPTPN